MTIRPEQTHSKGRTAAELACRLALEQFALRTREANERALDLFRQAIGHDPRFAPAYAGLASATCEAMVRYGHPRTQVDTAIELAQQSLRLDPNLVEGYGALASGYFAKGDLRQSLVAQHKVYDLKPTHPGALANIAFLHLDLGDLDDAVQWNHRALGLEPASAYIHRNFGRLSLMFGDDRTAERWLQKSIQLEPAFSSARILLVYLYFGRGDRQRALDETDRMLRHRPDDPQTLNFAADVALIEHDLDAAHKHYERAIAVGPDSRNFYRARRAKTGLAYVVWTLGDRTAARSLLDERLTARQWEYDRGLNCWGPPYEIAAIRAITGDPADGLVWFRRAIERGWREAHLAESDVLLAPVRDRPEFTQLLGELRVLNEQMQRRGGPLPPTPIQPAGSGDDGR